MAYKQLTLDDVHSYIQSFRIEAILDRAAGEIRTKNFVIRLTSSNEWEVTERRAQMEFVQTRIVAREIGEKRNKP